MTHCNVFLQKYQYRYTHNLTNWKFKGSVKIDFQKMHFVQCNFDHYFLFVRKFFNIWYVLRGKNCKWIVEKLNMPDKFIEKFSSLSLEYYLHLFLQPCPWYVLSSIQMDLCFLYCMYIIQSNFKTQHFSNNFQDSRWMVVITYNVLFLKIVI